MLTGRNVGSGTATSASGSATLFSLIVPDKSVPNLAGLSSECKLWRDTTKALSRSGGDVARRAGFAEEVCGVIIENLRLGIGFVMVAQAADSRLLGVATYFINVGVKEGLISLVAVAPQHVPGAGTAPGQLRGVGTALVAAVSREMLAAKVESVFLHPLDEDARRFWAGRGFGVCGLGLLMCVRGRDAIDRLRGSCELIHESSGDCLMCGAPGATVAARLPATASPTPHR